MRNCQHCGRPLRQHQWVTQRCPAPGAKWNNTSKQFSLYDEGHTFEPKQNGRPPNANRRVPGSVSLPRSLWARLARTAKLADLSVSELVETCCETTTTIPE